jgi:hypothetical protein
MTLQCDYHHRLLHEGAFGIVKEDDGALRFVTADGRTIPRNGYRLEDFVDDGIGAGDVAMQTRHVTHFAPRRCSTAPTTPKYAKRAGSTDCAPR